MPCTKLEKRFECYQACLEVVEDKQRENTLKRRSRDVNRRVILILTTSAHVTPVKSLLRVDEAGLSRRPSFARSFWVVGFQGFVPRKYPLGFSRITLLSVYFRNLFVQDKT